MQRLKTATQLKSLGTMWCVLMWSNCKHASICAYESHPSSSNQRVSLTTVCGGGMLEQNVGSGEDGRLEKNINEGDTDPKSVSPALLVQFDFSPPPPALTPPAEPSVWYMQPSCWASRLLLLREVEDLAVGLSQVLLLLEVHLKRPLDGHKCNTSL